jgi:hypothetical protein
MKNIKIKKRLPALVSFAVLIYLLLFLTFIKDNADDFLMGFTTGYQQSSTKENTLPDVYFLKVKPKSGVMSFPDSLVNLKTNERSSTRYFDMRATFSHEKPKPSFVPLCETLKVFLSFLVFAIFIFIPVKFYQLMKTFKKEIVFDQLNIKRIRLIGKALILLFLIDELYNYLSFKVNSALFSFSNYQIVKERTDLIWLLLGIIILIFAEIISRGKALKEEQDLTI